MTMQGYKPVFDKSAELAKGFNDFEHFRDYPELFHFIIAPPFLLQPDEDSLSKAKGFSPYLYEQLLAKGPSYGNQLDAIESRHILMMCFLRSKIGTDWWHVLEIGGGYGNWARLAQGTIDYTSWSILDIPHVTEVQRNFLKGAHDIEYNYVQAPIEVAISAHSMSEFSMQDFMVYLLIILSLETKYFLYVAHNTSPDPELLQEKLKALSIGFELIASSRYEGDNCTMYLGKRRKIYGTST